MQDYHMHLHCLTENGLVLSELNCKKESVRVVEGVHLLVAIIFPLVKQVVFVLFNSMGVVLGVLAMEHVDYFLIARNLAIFD